MQSPKAHFIPQSTQGPGRSTAAGGTQSKVFVFRWPVKRNEASAPEIAEADVGAECPPPSSAAATLLPLPPRYGVSQPPPAPCICETQVRVSMRNARHNVTGAPAISKRDDGCACTLVPCKRRVSAEAEVDGGPRPSPHHGDHQRPVG